MVVAILLAHTGQLGSLTNNGGWALELQGMFLFTRWPSPSWARAASAWRAMAGAGTEARVIVRHED